MNGYWETDSVHQVFRNREIVRQLEREIKAETTTALRLPHGNDVECAVGSDENNTRCVPLRVGVHPGAGKLANM